jgi:hypothetical protein
MTLTDESKLTKQQYQHREYRFTVTEENASDDSRTGLPAGAYRAMVTLRYDDECGNGHNTFAATASIYGGPWQKHNPKGEPVICGACCGLLARYVPECAEYERWHLCSSNGPMHYVANTVYLASEARELAAARRAAVWPDATDAELSAEPVELRAMLAARLPGLLAGFRAFVDGVGFVW